MKLHVNGVLPPTYAWFMYFFPFDTVTFQSKDLNLLPLKSRADYWWIVRSWNVLGTVTFFSWVFDNQMAIFSRSFKHLLHLPIFFLHSKSFYDHHCECSTLIFLLSKYLSHICTPLVFSCFGHYMYISLDQFALLWYY